MQMGMWGMFIPFHHHCPARNLFQKIGFRLRFQLKLKNSIWIMSVWKLIKQKSLKVTISGKIIIFVCFFFLIVGRATIENERATFERAQRALDCHAKEMAPAGSQKREALCSWGGKTEYYFQTVIFNWFKLGINWIEINFWFIIFQGSDRLWVNEYPNRWHARDRLLK